MSSEVTTQQQTSGLSTRETERPEDPLQQVEIINAPKNLSENQRKQLNALLEDIRLAFTWLCNVTNDQVQRKIESGELSLDDPEGIERYRLKVMDFNITRRASAWLNDSGRSTLDTAVEKKLSEFKADTLISLLHQLMPRPPKAAKLEEAVTQFAKDIRDGCLKQDKAERAYWIAVAHVTYDAVIDRFKAVFQTFNLQFTATQRQESSGAFGGKVDYVKIHPACVAAQYDFNVPQFEAVKDVVKETITSLTNKAIQG